MKIHAHRFLAKKGCSFKSLASKSNPRDSIINHQVIILLSELLFKANID